MAGKGFSTREQYKSSTGLRYIPDYLSVLEEQQILRNVAGNKARWKEVKGRRVQSFGGSIERGTLLAVPLPKWLQSVADRLHEDTQVFGAERPNHVLANFYQEGAGIHDHQDGPIYHPGVCIVSAGSSAVMNFRRRLPEGGFEVRPSASLLLQPRSLLVFCEDAYHNFLHGIDTAKEDLLEGDIVNLEATGLQRGEVVERQGDRVSLTVRRVLKTRKNLLRL